jgi:hypothetical protein
MAWICPCGATIRDDQPSCRVCGYQLSQPVPYQPPQYPQYQQHPQQPISQVTINYPQRPSFVKDLGQMGGTGAAKVGFGASFGIAAGWSLGNFFSCLVMIAVVIGILVVIGLVARLFNSDTAKMQPTEISRPALQAPANVPEPQPLERGSNDSSTSAEPLVAAPESVTPTSGVLCDGAIRIEQNGLLVFRDLPGNQLLLSFDRGAWQPSIRMQPDGRQTLTMRSTKPGIQTECHIGWEIAR